MMYEIVKKFLKLSPATERVALEIYERMPLPLRYRRMYGPSFLCWSALLKESEDWGDDRFAAYQIEQKRNLLIQAEKHVPYYRKLFADLGFRPGTFQSFDDLRQLPYLSKEEIRDHSREFVDERIPLKDLYEKTTSGSSGMPMTLYLSKESRVAFLAFRASILSRVGHTPRAREVMLWPTVQVGDRSRPFMRYGNRLVLSIRYLYGERILQYLDMIRKFEPEYILGYPSALTLFSRIVKDRNLPPYRRMRAVITYSETLSDGQRGLIEESFGSRVFSMYSMTECAAVGGECEYSAGLHIHPLYGILELGDSLYGHNEIIATGFTNYEMPFIRYRTGDLVSECKEFCGACGRRHRIVGTIEGRTHEFLVGKSGEILPALSSWVGTFPHVLQYQFFQEEPGRVHLRMVPGESFSESDRSFIVRELHKMFGETKAAIDIDLVFVDHIERTSSGKMKLLDQKLDVFSMAR